MRIEVHADGGSRGNPGPAGAGVKLEMRNSKSETEEMCLALYLGDQLTNNQAEYLAVIAAFKYLYQNLKLNEIERVSFFLDSELIVKQLNGEYKVKNKGLKKLHARVKTLEDRFKMVEYKHIGREENTGADRLVNLALDLRGC